MAHKKLIPNEDRKKDRPEIKPAKLRQVDLSKRQPIGWRERKKQMIDRFAGGVRGKPHSSPKGREASATRKFGRLMANRPEIKPFKIKQEPLPKMIRPKGLGHKAKGGRIGKQFGGRTNLLEELGRVEGEPSNRNRRAEISRVHGELNRGYKKGGRAGYSIGTIVKGAKKAITSNVFKPKGVFKKKPVDIDKLLKNLGDEIKAQPLPPKLKETMKKLQKAYPHKKAAGGRIGLRHGGSAGAATRGHGAEIK